MPAFTDDSQQRRWDRLRAVVTFISVALVLLAVLIIPPMIGSQGPLGRPQTHYVAIVDLTDPLAEYQLSTLKAEVQRWADSLVVGDRISLYGIALGKEGAASQELFSGQKPRDGSDANPWIETRRLLAKDFLSNFKEPLQSALKLEPSGSASQSPILQALYEVANKPYFADANRVVLQLWSDGLENSTILTHYKGSYSFKSLANRKSLYLSNLSGLHGAEVTVFLLKNQWERFHTPAHAKFWEDYFTAAGVASYEVEHI